MEFPYRLLSGRPPLCHSFGLGQIEQRFGRAQILAALEEFLDGLSPRLVELLSQRLPLAGQLQPFERTLQTTDLELVSDFFKFGPERNQLLKKQNGIPGRQIPQD